MEENNIMMGQRFTYHNQNFDKGEYLNIYKRVCQGQVMYTCRYKEEKSPTCWCTNLRIPRVLTMVLAQNIERNNGYLIPSKITIGTSVVLTHGIG